MNESNQNPESAESGMPNMTREEMLSAMFANMVIQQTNMAMMLMGKVAHPETGQFMQDFNTAKMFIDQLEMLAAKTRGNLSKEEEGLMKQALSTLHMTFVEAIDAAEKGGQIPDEPAAATLPEEKPTSTPAPPTEAAPKSAPIADPQAAADESRKKFSKKY